MQRTRAPENNVFYRNQNWHYPKISHGKGIYLFDESGQSWIDACSGAAVSNIGHGNSEIANYTKEHMERIAFTHLTRWTVDSIENCAAKVAEWMPANLNHVYFVSGGSEANEGALKMARQYFVERDGSQTRKKKIITKWNSFHGNTMGSLSMTGIHERRAPYLPLLIDFPHIPQFYHYRNPWDCENLEQTSIKAAEALEEEILKQGAQNIAAFISEPVVGAAAPGVHPEKIYFDMVREICTAHDILLIIDEVMAGFGRTGKKLGSNHFNIQPDIVTAAKGMSSGYTPIGATIASDEVHNQIMNEGSGVFVNGHTYAGNPLSCGIAYKVLEIIERESYVENAAVEGEYLLSKMQSLYNIPIVGDIRGKGLMMGVEIVKNQASKQPFPKQEKVNTLLMEMGLKNGIVLYPGGGSVDGTLGDHVLLSPPLNITREETNLLFKRLEQTLKDTAEKLI